MKYFIIVLSLFTHHSKAFNFGTGFDIDHDPRWRSHRDSIRLEVKKCNIIRNDISYNLNSKENTLNEIFTLISTVENGAVIVQKIKALIDSKKLLVKNLGYAERMARNLDKKTSALYDFTQNTATIYINFEDELGLVAHFLYHEMIHALDILIATEYEIDMVLHNQYTEIYDFLGLNRDPYKELSIQEEKNISNIYNRKIISQQRHAYRAERFAFNEQGYFTKRILKEKDCYQSYIDEHKEKNGLKLYEETPDAHIFSSYSIDPKNLLRSN